MSEVLGPIEKIEQIGQDIAWLNDAMNAEFDRTALGPSVVELIGDIEKEHPLMGQEVIARGRPLVPSMDEDATVHTLTALPEYLSARKGAVKGTYRGYGVRPVYLPEYKDHVQTMVHILETDQLGYADEAGNQHTVNNFHFVMAEGSRLEPILPMNNHNLKAMADSKTVERFDEILFDEALNAEQKIRRLGGFANRVFRHEGHLIDRQYRRVSYLNASGVLDGVFVGTRDFMIAHDREQYVAGLEVPTISEDEHSSVSVGGLMFDVLPGYKKMDNKSIRFQQHPELFLAAQIPNGWLALPVKSLDKIKKRGE